MSDQVRQSFSSNKIHPFDASSDALPSLKPSHSTLQITTISTSRSLDGRAFPNRTNLKQLIWHEEDSLEELDISTFSYKLVFKVFFFLYILPLVLNFAQQALPNVYDPDKSTQTTLLIILRLAMYAYLGDVLYFTLLPHVFDIPVQWRFVLIGHAAYTIIVIPIHLFLCLTYGYPNVKLFIIPVGFVVTCSIIVGINSYRFWRANKFKRAFWLHMKVVSFGLCFILGLTIFRWVFSAVGKDLQIVLGFFIPFLEYGAKVLFRKLIRSIHPKYTTITGFWFTHQATLYFLMYIIPLAEDNKILWVLVSSKLSLILLHCLLATDYYFYKLVFPSINTHLWERSQQAKQIYHRKIQVDFFFHLMNETLSIIYYYPIILVTRYTYNKEAYENYATENLWRVLYYAGVTLLLFIPVGIFLKYKLRIATKGFKLCILLTNSQLVFFVIILISATSGTVN